MLQDECSYLCSTILTSRNPSQAIDAALDLALMISSRKTRSILWQGDNDAKEKAEEGDENLDSFEISSPSKKKRKQTTVFTSILDVLSKAAANSKKQKNGGNSPVRSSRTKSARRKMKQLQSASSVVGSGGTVMMSPEMKQVLASIFYFLSWDCTMSDQYSVAVMGAMKAPNVARKLRLSILEHGEALQGALSLVLSKQQGGNVRSGSQSVVSSSIASSSVQKNGKEPKGAPASPEESCDDSASIQDRRKSRLDFWDSLPSIPESHGKEDVATSPGSSSNVSSVTFQDDSSSSKISSRTGDPTAAGRRKRRKRRNRMEMNAVAEEDDLDWKDSKIIPPPKATCSSKASHDTGRTPGSMSFTTEDNTFIAPNPPQKLTLAGSPDRSAASTVAVETSFMSARLSQKLSKLTAKVSTSNGCNDPSQFLRHELVATRFNDSAWVSMVCLESLNRIVTGKEEGSPSCIEVQESDSEDNLEDEGSNPILTTNILLGKTGAIPMMAHAMSESLRATCQQLENSCDHGWTYLHDRISTLASLIDGACLFNKSNRQLFCDEDPFSFEDRKEGLIFHLLKLLNCLRGRDTVSYDAKISGIMLLGLRTLTSLTHDNEIAAEQIKVCNDFGHDALEESSSIRGLDVLAGLVFELEANGEIVSNGKKQISGYGSDEDLQRYDCTIFCLNTLANIIEAEGVRMMLAEVVVANSLGIEIQWLKWLCQWLVSQTETFRDAIMGIGKGKESSSSERELQKSEEDRLVAAGNACVLLACLMTEPEEISEEPESTNTIRNLIIEQMPKHEDGSSTGVTMIINTLRAFCNFYHYSLGELSVAVVTPVKKLIQELEDLQAVR